MNNISPNNITSTKRVSELIKVLLINALSRQILAEAEMPMEGCCPEGPVKVPGRAAEGEISHSKGPTKPECVRSD